MLLQIRSKIVIKFFFQDKYGITTADFICCQYVKADRMHDGQLYPWQFNYFYAKLVSEEEFKTIERGCLDSEDFGTEVGFLTLIWQQALC